MTNIHKRLLDHPIDSIRPWISRLFSGTSVDCFPRDMLPSWRTSDNLVPGETKLGYGPFSFTLRWWDGTRWRADLDSNAGYQAIFLQAQGKRTRVIHTLDASLSLVGRLSLIPIHDWAIEAMFDRLETAVATSHVPTTLRPMGFVARRMYEALQTKRGFGGLSFAT
jgi:hypothetical protein